MAQQVEQYKAQMKDIQGISYETKEKAPNICGIKIVSIAIFGSTARCENHADSDVDLLVIAEGIAKKRIQRIPDIVKIKRELNLGFPLDILLVSKDECQLNFRNHNPLYLDIALDAEIIYDTGFLENLIEETREYIDSNNIRRGVDSWSFPVKERTATNLSKISNKEWALVWLEDGRRDLLAASYLFDLELNEKSVYHCQQTVEKVTKAVLAVWGEFRKTHFVADALREECNKRELGEWKEKLIEIAEIGNKTEPQVSLSRYPGLTDNTLWLPYEEYDTNIAKEYLQNAEIAFKIGEEFIKWWFQ